jgi:uncharacterized protein YecT (DUF1311 family)
MFFIKSFLVGAFAAVASAALAAPKSEIEKRYSPTYDYCMNNGDAALGITPAMGACISAEHDVQDGRLNQAYKMVMQRLSASKKIKLRNSEKLWISQRDKDCKEERDSYEGGSMASLVWGTCMINATIKRTMWLEKYK